MQLKRNKDTSKKEEKGVKETEDEARSKVGSWRRAATGRECAQCRGPSEGATWIMEGFRASGKIFGPRLKPFRERAEGTKLYMHVPVRYRLRQKRRMNRWIKEIKYEKTNRWGKIQTEIAIFHQLSFTHTSLQTHALYTPHARACMHTNIRTHTTLQLTPKKRK